MVAERAAGVRAAAVRDAASESWRQASWGASNGIRDGALSTGDTLGLIWARLGGLVGRMRLLSRTRGQPGRQGMRMQRRLHW
jgi:hypothetical protein